MQRNIFFLSILACTSLQAENALQIIPAKLTDGAGTLSVQIVSESSMSACQMDISLPSGLTLGSVALGDNANNGHTVLSRDLGTSDTYDGYNTYRLLIYSTSNGSFAAQTGQIISLPVSGILADGTYAVYADNAIIDNAQAADAHQSIALNTQCSYLTVGNQTSQRVALSGVVPSYVVDAINSDATVTAVDLTSGPTLDATLAPVNPNTVILTSTTQGYSQWNEVTDGTCASFHLTDGYAFGTPNDFTATSATYSRTGQTYQWGTLCLPYAVASNADIQYYTLTSSAGSTLTFCKVDNVAAGTPTLYKILSSADAESGKYSLTATNSGCTITASGLSDALEEVPNWSMHGTYQPLTGVTGVYYIAKNQFWYATKGVAINPFRAWFENANASASETRFTIEEAEENDIEIIEDESTSSVQLRFDLSGRRVDETHQGIHIINNQKTLQQ